MRYYINTETKKPAYMQLYYLLRDDIINGVYGLGEKIPSKRLLASDTGTSVITVMHAYELLVDEGYVESRERSGYYVVYRSDNFVSVPADVPERYSRRSVVPSGSSFPFSTLAKTMRKIISDYGERLLIKSPNNGCIELRTAISKYLSRSCGIECSPEQIVIGAGAEYLYGMLAELMKNIISEECVFGIESPSYEKIKLVYRANNITIEELPLGANGVISQALSASSADVLHVTPFNSFPSGISADASKRREYISWMSLGNRYIIEDNYDSELTPALKHEDTLFSMADSRVIYLNTFSRTISPSVRVGYMVLPEELVPFYRRSLGFNSCTVGIFEQYVIAELIESGVFERHINRIRREKRKNP